MGIVRGERPGCCKSYSRTRVFCGGANAGLTRTVKSYGSGLFRFALQLPHPPASGDTFTVYPGCPKTQAACKDKFSNLIHFRGYPYVPPAETAL